MGRSTESCIRFARLAQRLEEKAMNSKARNVELVFGAELDSPIRKSVSAELLLLQDCCADSSTIQEDLRTTLLDKLRSQGGLASLECAELGIVSMSLNTHKSAADGVIVGGFKTLDSYRRAALVRLREHLVASSRPTRGTIAWHKQEHEKMKSENDALANSMVLLTARLDDVMDYARRLAIKSNKSEEFLAKQSELLRKFPPRGT